MTKIVIKSPKTGKKATLTLKRSKAIQGIKNVRKVG